MREGGPLKCDAHVKVTFTHNRRKGVKMILKIVLNPFELRNKVELRERKLKKARGEKGGYLEGISKKVNELKRVIKRRKS